MLLLGRLLLVARLLLLLMVSWLLEGDLLLLLYELVLVTGCDRWRLRDHWLVFLHDNVLMLRNLDPHGRLFSLFVLHRHRLTSLLILHLLSSFCLVLIDSPLLDLIIFSLLEFVAQESHNLYCALLDDLASHLLDWVSFYLKRVYLLVEADPVGHLFHFVV